VVTLVDPGPRSAVGAGRAEPVARLAQAWKAQAITLRLGTTATGIDRDGDALVVRLADGDRLEADLVLSAVGLRPAIGLAQEAGLVTRRGIVVDGHGQTSAPGIYALGDCAEYTLAGGSAVLPYVAPLMAAARDRRDPGRHPDADRAEADAVIVKTPSYRLALAPPPPAGLAGSWVDLHEGAQTVARFVDAEGKVRGFGVSAPTPAQRQSLLAELVSN
jgi:rubredoxin-NAD+ reductase